MIKKEKERIILGLDPGTTITGFGVLEQRNSHISLLRFGVIRLGRSGSHELRLKKIFTEVIRLIDECKPDEVVLEGPFYGKNVQSLLKLGRAQGVAMAAALSRQIPVTEYAPRKVKQAVTGHGNASKEQVARMLMTLFNLREAPQLLDATDALAVALCHLQMKNTRTKKGKKASWEDFVKDNPQRIKS
jgi:crossover junction endodeoxyribonuclease RuvC